MSNTDGVSDPVVPDRAREDHDENWGDRPEDDADDRLERERPPHHDKDQ